MPRRWIGLMIAACLSVAHAGCGGSSRPVAPSPEPAAVRPPSSASTSNPHPPIVQTDARPVFRVEPSSFTIAAEAPGVQLLATGTDDGGAARDLTARAIWRIEPAGIATIDPSGYVLPLKAGKATIIASEGVGEARATVVVAPREQAVLGFRGRRRPDPLEAWLQRRGLPREDRRPERVPPLAVRLRSRGRLQGDRPRRRSAAGCTTRPPRKPAAVESHGTDAARGRAAHTGRLARLSNDAPVDHSRAHGIVRQGTRRLDADHDRTGGRDAGGAGRATTSGDGRVCRRPTPGRDAARPLQVARRVEPDGRRQRQGRTVAPPRPI